MHDSSANVPQSSALHAEAHQKPQSKAKSYLEQGVDKAWSLLIHDGKTRETVDQYTTGFLTSVPLFIPGVAGVLATGAMYGLNNTRSADSAQNQVIDFALGAAKGEAIKGIFHLGAGLAARPSSPLLKMAIAPLTGGAMGLGSRSADALIQRDTFTDPNQALQRWKDEVTDWRGVTADGAAMMLGQGVFMGVNKLSRGMLASSKLMGSITTGGTFGAANGAMTDIKQQEETTGHVDWTHVLESGAIQGGLGAAAAGIGMNMRMPGLNFKLPEMREAMVESTGSNLRPADDGERRIILDPIEARKALQEVESAQDGRVVLQMPDGSKQIVSEHRTPISVWRNRLYSEGFELKSGDTTINLMSPLVVGDPMNLESEQSKAAWADFRKDVIQAKKLNPDVGIATDVWWGLVEPEQGQFNWAYYDKMAATLKELGVKWNPNISLHQCGGNVGDNFYVPLPKWVWEKVRENAGAKDVRDVQFVSEQGNASPEYISFWATPHALDLYGDVMRNFRDRYASYSPMIPEIAVSLGPAGEMRYPSYNSHDKNVEYPSRGALQIYSEMARESLRDWAIKKYGSVAAVGKAWNIDGLTRDRINPPDNAQSFFDSGSHMNTQYGRDLVDWMADQPLNHGRAVIGTALKIFGEQGSPYNRTDIAAKFPGVHWQLGHWDGDKLVLGSRIPEISAGLIRTSRNDWYKDSDGRGYRPLLSMFRELQPLRPGMGNRVVPYFTAIEMSDGQDGAAAQSLPHTLAAWVGMEASRQGLTLKGENALAGTLSNPYSWEMMRSLLALPGYAGYYHGWTLLRMGDVVNNPEARAKLAEIISAINSLNNTHRKDGNAA